MNASNVFDIANVLPLPIWALWLLAPRAALSRRLARTLWPWQLLAALYLATLVVAFATAPAGGSFDMGSLEGVMGLFGQEWAALAGWVHYLCFDLFVGRWIMNDAPEGGYRLAPVLLLTLLAGPVGLLTYTAARGFFRGGATTS